MADPLKRKCETRWGAVQTQKRQARSSTH